MNQPGRHLRIEHHRTARGFYFSRSQPRQRAPGRNLADRLGVVERLIHPARGVPVADLHPALVLRDRRDPEMVRSARVLAREAIAVGEHDPIGTRIEFRALRIFDPRIEFSRRIFRDPRKFERASCVDNSVLGVGQLEIGKCLRMERRVRKSRPRIGRGQAREIDRALDKVAQRVFLDLGRGRSRGGLPAENPQTEPALTRTLQLLNLAEAHAGRK